jgi:hypothetical protein
MGMASGRAARADAAVLAAAYELAPLARRLASRVAVGVGTTLGETMAAHGGEVRRILALAASIEGTVLGPSAPARPGERVFLGDLAVGRIYVTHHAGGDLEWACKGVGPGGAVVVESGGSAKSVDGGDLGLCAYGAGSGAWHPHSWTEATGATSGDGAEVMRRVGAGQPGVEFDFDDEE